MSKKKFIDAQKLKLDEWVKIVLISKNKRNCLIEDSYFATDRHLEEYVETIHHRSEKEIKQILANFLISGGHLGSDQKHRLWLFSLPIKEIEEKKAEHSYFKRLSEFCDSSAPPPWQGITWVIDLLPKYPQEAINALESYLVAHCLFLPDGRAHALSDASTIIRKKYLEHDLPVKNTLLNLTPCDFELLVGYLYKKKGYDVTITPRSKDGGYDVLAEKNNNRENERLHIECKRYDPKVGVIIIRGVLGTLLVEPGSKAVIVTSSSFTRPAIIAAKKSKRVELISGDEFDKDMRENIDNNWTSFVTRYVMEMKKFL